MNRRDTLFALCAMGAAVTPFAARAQQPGKVRRIGVLFGTTNDLLGQAQLAALREGLQQHGWMEGRNVEIEYRWGEGNITRMRTQAEALVSGKPDVIAVSTATALREVQRAAGKLPIVFWSVSDPVGNKFVQSLARPGGNVTGFSLFQYEMGGKWLQLLKEVAPQVTRVLILQNARNPNWPQWLRAFESVEPSLGLELIRPRVSESTQIEPEISAFARGANGGVLVLPDPFFAQHRDLILQLTAKFRLPSVYGTSTYTQGGGLISYGIDQVDLAKKAASYVSRILNSERPGDLPIQAPTKFELVVNMKTARALGLRIPASILLAADQVRE